MPAPTSIWSSRSAPANCWRAWRHSCELAQCAARSERALRYRSEQYQTLLNQAPLGVYVVDADFRIREVESGRDCRCSAIFPAASSAAISTKSSTSSGTRSMRTKSSGIFRHTLATGEPYVAPSAPSGAWIAASSKYYEWRVDRITLPDGRFGLVCYFRDISEQKTGARREGVPRRHRRLGGRRHHREGSRRHHPVVQRRGRAAVRLFGRRTGRAAGAHADSRRNASPKRTTSWRGCAAANASNTSRPCAWRRTAGCWTSR